MDKLKVLAVTALRSKRFYAGVALVVASLGFTTGGSAIDSLSTVLCTLAGGCTP